MTEENTKKRQEVIKLAESYGWKSWGKLRKYGNSYYECFRRGNEYIWIGLRYIQTLKLGYAIDFIDEELDFNIL